MNKKQAFEKVVSIMRSAIEDGATIETFGEIRNGFSFACKIGSSVSATIIDYDPIPEVGKLVLVWDGDNRDGAQIAFVHGEEDGKIMGDEFLPSYDLGADPPTWDHFEVLAALP